MIPSHKIRRAVSLTKTTSDRLDGIAKSRHVQPSRIIEQALRDYLAAPVTRQRLEADEKRNAAVDITPLEAAILESDNG